MTHHTADLRIKTLRPLISPAIIYEELPVTDEVASTVLKARSQISNILKGDDDRLIAIVGPCSIHDTEAALEYTQKLKTAMQKFADDLCVVMRVYFEKPRTTIGWKGLINDPELDNSYHINKGLRTARKLLIDINQQGLPTGTEFLDTIIPQFISDLIAWGAIGARTTESQIHRELASGLSMPIGFKNGTNGNVQIAIDAVGAAKHPHHFLGVTRHGTSAIVGTTGNKDCHVILRGAKSGPNYSVEHIQSASTLLEKAKLPQKIMVDCSHGNSKKDHTKQPLVANELGQQIASGDHTICGVMLESHLIAGNQNLKDRPLKYGQSITDACMDWDTTEKALEQLAKSIQQRRKL